MRADHFFTLILKSFLWSGLIASFFLRPAQAQTLQWTPSGPASIFLGYNPSVQTNNGRIDFITADPSNSSHILISSNSGGIWESFNQGVTWAPRTDNSPLMASGPIAFCSGTPSVVYSANIAGDYDGYVFRSADGGTTWSVVADYTTAMSLPAGTQVYYPQTTDIHVDPTDPNSVMFDASEPTWGWIDLGVFKSTDGGATWTKPLVGSVMGFQVASNFNDQYAANSVNAGSNPNSAIYRSTNGGTTWNKVTGPWSTDTGLTQAFLAIAPSNDNILYVITANSSGNDGFFVTNNAWAATPTWTTLTTPQSDIPYAFLVSPSNSNMVYINYYTNYTQFSYWNNSETFDLANGANSAWNAPPDLYHADGRGLGWAGTKLFAGCDGGLFVSTDQGNSFSDTVNRGGLQTAMFYNLAGAVQKGHPNVLFGGSQDNGVLYSTGSQYFNEYQGGDGTSGQSCMYADSNLNWLGSNDIGIVARSTNLGASFSQAGTMTQGNCMVRSPNNENIVLVGNGGIVYKSTNFFSAANAANINWTANTAQVVASGGGNATINYAAFAASDTTSNTYAFSTGDNQLWLTQNGGTTWKKTLDTGLPDRNISDLAFDPTNGNILYVVLSGFDVNTPSTPGHVFKTTNALAANPTWTNIDDGVDIPHDCIAVDPNAPTHIYVGTDIGMLYSTNSGTSWTAMNPATTGMPNVTVSTLVFDQPTSILTAFTYGRGIFQMSTDNTTTPTPTNTLTHTSTQTATNTATCTATHTATQTMTHTATMTSSSTSSSTQTATKTSTRTATQTATNTLTCSATQTSSPTLSPTQTVTNTATNVITNTNTSTPSATSTYSPANTFTSTQTHTVSSTQTVTMTATVTNTQTCTVTHTQTNTITFTATNTITSTQTLTSTLTNTLTSTFTSTQTPTITSTVTATVTKTPTPTCTSTPTNTVTQTTTPNLTQTPLANCPGVPDWSGNNFVYVKGQTVGFNGRYYQCVQNHTSNSSLYPTSEPSLWMDMGPCGTTPTAVTGTGTPVIYPNPSNGSPVHISIPLASPANVTVKIFTLSFRRIQQSTYTDLVPGTDVTLTLMDSWGNKLANGLYYVVVDVGQTRTICKLLIIQ